MTYALLAALAGWTVTVCAFARLLASGQRAHARREDLLLNQLLHAAGKTWTPPPAAANTPVASAEPEGFPVDYTWAPEQDPVGY